MSLLVMTSGDNQLLKLVTNNASQENFTLHLYTNNYAPTTNDLISNYTECTLTGYSAPVLASNTWAISNAIATYSGGVTLTFTTGNQTIYGYYITGTSSGILYWAELFQTPLTIPSGGGSVEVIPSISFN